MIRFTVYGKPQPAGSKRAFPFRKRDGKLGVAVSDMNPNARDWKNAIASAARLAYGDGPLLDGPLRVAFVFTFARPKGHFGSGSRSQTIKGSAPKCPAVKPDLLKVARGAEDALTGVIWRDDSQICAEHLVKFYGEPAQLEVLIERFDPDACFDDPLRTLGLREYSVGEPVSEPVS